MKDINKITESLSVSGDVNAEDVGEIAAKGFKSIINNRPDYEAAGQEPSADIEASAKELGIKYRHIPVMSGMVTDDAAEQFGQALGELEPPILAFCRSGTRSTTLWALASAMEGAEPSELEETAAEAGYDITSVHKRLEQHFAAGAKKQQQNQ